MRDMFQVPDADPNYKYRWVNQRDRMMLQRLQEGWEVVKGSDIPSELRIQLQSSVPSGLPPDRQGEIRTRMDTVLMRMPMDAWKERIQGPKEAARKRQQVEFDSMVLNANEQVRSELKRRGYSAQQIRGRHVFTTDSEPDFKQEGVK